MSDTKTKKDGQKKEEEECAGGLRVRTSLV